MIYQIHQQDAELRGREIGREEGISIGEERGEKRGKQREKLNNAKGMLRENFPIDAISRITGLPISEINKLKASAN